jgi:Flp pilus assembly protein TadG
MFGRLLDTLKRFRREEGGAVMIETAVLLTFALVPLTAGVFEFGNLIHQKLLIEAGLRDAARYAARCNTQIYTDAGLSIDCAANAENIALYGNAAGTGSLRIPTWSETQAGRPANQLNVAIGDPARCHDAVVGGALQYHSVTPQVCIVRATATFQYRSIGLFAIINVGDITLTPAHEERLVRF